MEDKQYIEIDSSYRDRNSYQEPGDFEIPAWSFNSINKYNAIDPVSDSAIIHSWHARRFKFSETSNLDYSSITLTILNTTTSDGTSSDRTTIIISTPSGHLQPIPNYYSGAVGVLQSYSGVYGTRNPEFRRILSYVYLGNDKGRFTFESPFSFIVSGDTIIVTEPTNIEGSPFSPSIFVPNGSSSASAYNNCYIQNMNNPEYRKIKSYDPVTRVLIPDTDYTTGDSWSSGPVRWYGTSSSFVIRKEPVKKGYYILNCDFSKGQLSIFAPWKGWDVQGYPGILNDVNKSSFIFNTINDDSYDPPLDEDYTGDFIEIGYNPPPYYQWNGGITGNSIVSVKNAISANIANTVVYGSTTTLAVNAFNNKGIFDGYIIRMTSGASKGLECTISNYTSTLATFSPGFWTSVLDIDSPGISPGDTYLLYKPNTSFEARRITKYVREKGVAKGGSLTSVILDDNASMVPGFYNNLRIRFLSGDNVVLAPLGYFNTPYYYVDVLIINYTVQSINGEIIRTAYFEYPRYAENQPIDTNWYPIKAGDKYEFASGIVYPPFGNIYQISFAVILPYSYENLRAFTNISSSVISQKDTNRYRIELINIIIPNASLAISDGMRIVDYSYLYLEIYNSTLATQGNFYMYSNNPNSRKAIFRIPIDDVTRCNESAFLKLDGDGTIQTISYRYRDNLKVSLKLPTGEVFKTVQLEHFGPLSPNRLSQISMLVSLKRIITK